MLLFILWVLSFLVLLLLLLFCFDFYWSNRLPEGDAASRGGSGFSLTTVLQYGNGIWKLKRKWYGIQQKWQHFLSQSYWRQGKLLRSPPSRYHCAIDASVDVDMFCLMLFEPFMFERCLCVPLPFLWRRSYCCHMLFAFPMTFSFLRFPFLFWFPSLSERTWKEIVLCFYDY